MASIQSLLNPLPEHLAPPTPRFDTSYTFPTDTERAARNLYPGRQKGSGKQKMPKDAPVFKENSPTGEIRYPPCEDRPTVVAEEHLKVNFYPMGADGRIDAFPRTIPYRSEKKSFEEKTGRNKLEVYQYTFQYGDPEKEWMMMWDYNIGLVRITHLFKALGYTKTTPARVLTQNPGLRDICHSITGGAIAAQGYWMPFDVAKALAARFCHPIRYALTPMFGMDFPEMCVEKGHENFGNMTLDQNIIDQAARKARHYRSLEPLVDSLAGTESTSSIASSDSPVWRTEMPLCPSLLNGDGNRPFKFPRHEYADSIASTRGSSSEPYCMSPSSEVHNCFTPVNAPRSHAPQTEAFLSRAANAGLKIQAARCEESEALMLPPMNLPLDVHHAPSLSRSDKEEGSMLGKSPAAAKYDSDTDGTGDSIENDSIDDDRDEDWREHESRCSTESSLVSERDRAKGLPTSGSTKGRTRRTPPVSRHFAREVKAAHALINLHMQKATAGDDDEDEDGDVTMRDGSSDSCHLVRMSDEKRGTPSLKRRRASV